MSRETKAEREDAADAAALKKADEDAAKAAAKEPKGAAARAELQNLKDRVAANQADEIARSFAKLDALLADA